MTIAPEIDVPPVLTPEAFNARVNAGRRVAEMALLDRLTAAYAEALRSVAGDVARRFTVKATRLDAVAAAFNPTLVAAAVMVAAADPNREPKFIPPDPNELVPKAKLEAEIEKRTRQIREQIVAVTIGDILATAGVSFEIGGIFDRRILKQVGLRARDADKSTRDAIRTVIDRAQTEGWTVPETAAGIKEHIVGLSDSTATMLARTDLIGTSNASADAAAHMVFEGANIVKRWTTADDERVRPTHQDAEGQTVPMSHPFQVGEALLDYPGDPSGPDEEVIQCRCVALYLAGEPVTAAVWRSLTAAFNPALHPREPEGTRVGGRWAKKGGYRQASDETASPEMRDLAREFRVAPEDFFPEDGSPDGALREIVRMQGYDGLPEVVSEEELRARLPQWDDEGYKINDGDGSLELWRGVDENEAVDAGTSYAEQFRSGPYYIGEGLYGNGTYATTNRDLAAAYTYDSKGLTNPNPRGLMHMALHPEAKVVRMEDSDFQRNWKSAAYDADGVLVDPLYLDAGRYAAARGYDAMVTPDGNYVIFNRTALVVAR